MKLSLPLKTAVNFPPSVAILGYAKLQQESILHQTTCDSKNRVSLFACAIDHCGEKGSWINKIRTGIILLWLQEETICGSTL